MLERNMGAKWNSKRCMHLAKLKEFNVQAMRYEACNHAIT